MQAAKNAVENIKETAANIGASAKSGIEKTKAAVQEKAEKMNAHDPIQKDMATQRKEERIHHAEQEKQEARQHNAAAKQAAIAGHVDKAHYTTAGPGTHSTTGFGSGPNTLSSTGLGSGPGTHSTTGFGIGSGPATHSATGLGSVPTTNSTTGIGIGPGTHSNPGLGSGPTTHSTTGIGSGIATYSTPVDYAQAQPLGLGHKDGIGHGDPMEEVLGSHQGGTNTGISRTGAHNTHVGGTGPLRGHSLS